jgi:mRNA-degrading endonuclease RelE of RelBE toxin-antitoxin system
MPYLVNFTPQAEKDLARLDKIVAQNVANKIDWLLALMMTHSHLLLRISSFPLPPFKALKLVVL